MAKRKYNRKPVESQHEEKSFFAKIWDFYNNNKVTVLTSLVVIVGTLITVAVLTQMRNRKEMDASEKYDTAMTYIQYIWMVEDEETQNAYTQQHFTLLNELLTEYPDTVAAVRARLYMGKIYYIEAFQNGDTTAVSTALSYYTQAREKSKSDFYYTLATLGMALCREFNNEYSQALELYQEIVDDYNNEGFTATALVGMARCKEILADVEAALTYYQQVADDYPDSRWSRFAKGKIYFYTGQADYVGSASVGTVVPSLGTATTTASDALQFVPPAIE